MGDSLLQLPLELLEASKQINEPETVEGKKAAISAFLLHLEEKLQEGDTLPSERDALKYLRLRKFRIDDAVATYCNRLAFFKEHADILKDIQLEEFHDIYADSIVRVLPGLDKHGRRIMCLRVKRPERFQMDVLMLRWMVYCLDVLANDLNFQVNGMVTVQNLEEIRLRDALHVAGLFRDGRMRKLFYYIQDCSPARLSNIFILNAPPIISIVWKLLRMVLKPKLRERVKFCSRRDTLHDVVDPSVLPPLWGGTSDDDPWAWYNEQQQAQSS